MSRPCAPSACPSAKAAGTVGDTACVGGLDIGSKSSTCMEAALTYAASAGEVSKPKPHAVLRAFAPWSLA